jgi:hypothetical protein
MHCPEKSLSSLYVNTVKSSSVMTRQPAPGLDLHFRLLAALPLIFDFWPFWPFFRLPLLTRLQAFPSKNTSKVHRSFTNSFPFVYHLPSIYTLEVNETGFWGQFPSGVGLKSSKREMYQK